MRVIVHPADRTGCGWLRMTAPGRELSGQGHDVRIIQPEQRQILLDVDPRTDTVRGVRPPPGGWPDVMVFQRITHPFMAQAVPFIRSQGVAVVVDVDDDLTAIHPDNPAWEGLHPSGPRSPYSWRNVSVACREATLVTVSTPALLDVYARHGRGVVLPNVLPREYGSLTHSPQDPQEIVWPASYHSHPDDPYSAGGSVARLVSEGASFRMIGDPSGAGKAFGLSCDPPGSGVPLTLWPQSLSCAGIGIAPLADTRFNRSKSWLKPLELCAAGVPWVASPRAEYTRLHTTYKAGVLAERSRSWYRELSRLRDSPEYRADLSGRGRSAADSLRLEDHAWRWLEAWQEAVRIQQGRRASLLVR